MEAQLTTKAEPNEVREKVWQLESALLASENQIHIEPKHYFAPGIYMREIFIPKGVVLTGKIHKTEHMCILSKGSVSVWTGEESRLLHASSVVHSKIGSKRAIYALEDSVWINVHHNPENEQDIEKIEAMYVANSKEEFLAFTEQRMLEGGK